MSAQLLRRMAGLLPASLIKRVGLWQARVPFLHRLVAWAGSAARDSDQRIQRGQGEGLLFCIGPSNFGYVTGTAEPQTQAILAEFLKSGDVFYDIGANVGFMTVIAARRVGPSGQVYSFDPLPRHAELVRHNAAINKLDHVTVFQCAVSDKTGQARFSVAPIPATSKLAGPDTREDDPSLVTVDVVSIDQLIAEKHLRPPTVIKIDVEGAELGVLRGLQNTLRDYQPVVVCDTHGTHKEVAAILSEYGYDAVNSEHREQSLANADYYSQALAHPAAIAIAK